MRHERGSGAEALARYPYATLRSTYIHGCLIRFLGSRCSDLPKQNENPSTIPVGSYPETLLLHRTIILHPTHSRCVRAVCACALVCTHVLALACMQTLHCSCSFCSHMDLQRWIQGPGKPHKLPSNPGKTLNQSVYYQLLFLTICTLLLAAAVRRCCPLLPPMLLVAVACHCSPFCCCCCCCCLLFLLLSCASCQSVCYHSYLPSPFPFPM